MPADDDGAMPTPTSGLEPSRARKPAPASTPTARTASGTPPQPQSEHPHGRSAPETVNGSTRVNIAFPFSKINVQQPSPQLAELAALVHDLIAAVEAGTGAQLKELRQRSQELIDQLA